VPIRYLWGDLQLQACKPARTPKDCFGIRSARPCSHDHTSSSSAPYNRCVLVYLQTAGSEGSLSHSVSSSACAAPEASGAADDASALAAAGFSLVHEEPGRPTGGVVMRSPLTKVYLKTGSTRSCSLCCSLHFVSSGPPPPPLSGRCPDSAVPGSTNNDTSRTRERQKGVPAAGCGGSTRALGTVPAPFPPFPPLSFFFGGILACHPSSLSTRGRPRAFRRPQRLMFPPAKNETVRSNYGAPTRGARVSTYQGSRHGGAWRRPIRGFSPNIKIVCDGSQ